MMKLKFVVRMMYLGFLPVLSICIALMSMRPVRGKVDPKPLGNSEAVGNILTISPAGDKNWFVADHGVFINVVVKNTTKENLIYGITNNIPSFKFSVADEKHEVMPLTRYGSSRFELAHRGDKPRLVTMQVRIELAPGKERKVQLLLSQFYDMSVPGKYFVTASMDVGIGQKAQHIKSNKLQLEVDSYNHGELSLKEMEYREKQREKQAKEQDKQNKKTNETNSHQ